jgi:anti-sigma regulatory factor (Ser/Thr protein kinase)
MAINASDWSHEATFASTPISASKSRHFVCGHLLEHRLPHLVDDVRLVVSELATNAVVHARTAFVVTLAVVDGTLLLTVRDGSLCLPARGPRPAMGTSGRGLEIVDSVSLDWGINEDTAGTKAVWASFATANQHENQPRHRT